MKISIHINTLFLLIALPAGVAIITALYQYHVPIGSFIWQRFGWDTAAAVLNPNDANLFFEIGNAYFGRGETYDIQKAQKAFSRALELRYTFPEAHYQLARIYFLEGKFDFALAKINETLLYAPDFKKAYYMYGLINGYLGDLDEAIYGFNEFIRRDDFNWAGYNDLAWIYFRKGDYRKTKEVAEAGLQHAPRNPWLTNIYGVALLNLGDKEKAREALRIALEESETMSAQDWGKAYPGNDPAIYRQGLEEMHTAIRRNLDLLL